PEIDTVLVLTHGKLLPGERVRRIEPRVAHVLVHVTTYEVRTALGDNVDVAAERASELRLAARRHHLKLIDGIDAIRNPAQRRGIVIGGEAIDDEVVREVALAAHRHPDADDGRGFRKKLRAA